MKYGALHPNTQAKIDAMRKDRNAKCEAAWKDLESGRFLSVREAAENHGVSKTQLHVWLGLYKKGQMSAVILKSGITRNDRSKRTRGV